jgi:hypothetical protein
MMGRDGGRRDAGNGSGPFPGPDRHEQPWRASETEHGPFERRRGVDRRALESDDGGPERRRRRWGRRKSDVLTSEARATLTARGRALARRFREPLIGLTLAGVAAPLVNAGLNVTDRRAGERADAADRDAARSGDLDLAVGDYWAEAAEALVRERTVEGAMVRWGIPQEMSEQIYDAAARYEIEPDVAYGLVFVESTFRERAVSHVGARGLAQVMPRTARWLDPSVSTGDLFDPEVNLELGFRYLRQMLDKYDGDLFKALTAYNRGPGTVDRILRRGGNPDNGYARKVMEG